VHFHLWKLKQQAVEDGEPETRPKGWKTKTKKKQNKTNYNKKKQKKRKRERHTERGTYRPRRRLGRRLSVSSIVQ
jgi:hypothetical protein